jgi:hypothetical protein
MHGVDVVTRDVAPPQRPVTVAKGRGHVAVVSEMDRARGSLWLHFVVAGAAIAYSLRPN